MPLNKHYGIIFLVLMLSPMVEARYSEAELKNFDQIVNSFSPLPIKPDLEIPDYRGVRFTFYHTLRNLEGCTKFFKPNSVDRGSAIP